MANEKSKAEQYRDERKARIAETAKKNAKNMEKKNIIGCVAYLAICLAVYALGDALPRVNFGEGTLCSWVVPALVGLSAAGSILGGIFGNRQRRKQRRALQDKQRKLDAWRDEQLICARSEEPHV